VALRAWTFVGASHPVWSDTRLYRRVESFPLTSDRFWGGLKPWTLPLFLKVLPGDGHAGVVATAQWAISVASWIVLALVLARLVEVRLVALVPVLLLGLLPSVTIWDPSVLSESLALSLTALLLAAALLVAERATPARAAALVTVAFLWAGIRETDVYVLPFLLLPLAALVWRRRAAAASLAVATVAVLAIGLWSLEHGRRWYLPFLDITGQRVLVSEQPLSYYEGHGMPVTPALRRQAGKYWRAFEFNPRLAGFRGWVLKDGQATYRGYLLSHPGYVLARPWGERSRLFAPRLDPYRPHGTHTVGRDVGFTGLVVAGLVALGLAAFSRPRREWIVPLAVLVSTFPHALLVWHSEPLELERHAVPLAVLTRLGIVLLAVFAVDGIRSRRGSLRR
jgi:hypothetical protein